MSRHINLALLVIATICVLIRFVARWRIQGSTLGWDDWTILASFVLLIPSTAILQLSSFTSDPSVFVTLTLAYSDFHWTGQ
jgi:hypothetical protein